MMETPPRDNPFTFPQHLAVHCSDKILMHINRPTNFQQLMELSISDLSRLDTLTDVTLVPGTGEKVKVHGFLLSAASPFLREVLSSTFSPSLEYTILLPGVSGSVVSSLTQMLYGASVLSCRDTLPQLYRLVDILGIHMELVTDSVTETPPSLRPAPAPEEDLETIIAPVEGDKVVKFDDKDSPSIPAAEETVGEEALPLCCYHCSQPFQSFDSLSSHICTKAGAGKRHHRCNQCGTVLSSMWRLRQHLAGHAQSQETERREDHVYGRSSRRVAAASNKTRVRGDHGYAGGKKHPKEIQEEKEVTSHPVTDHGYAGTSSRKPKETLERLSYGGRRLMKPETAYTESLEAGAGAVTDHGYAGTGAHRAVTISTEDTGDAGDHRYLASGVRRRHRQMVTEAASFHTLTPPGSRVQSEHSYGTTRDSSPEPEVENRLWGEHGGQLGDHLYSADKEDTAEDTETDTDPENNDVLEEENSANVRVDHQYSSSQERKSPRFRKILPRAEPKSETNKSEAAAGLGMKECDQCGKSFPQLYRLKRHIREVHDQEKGHKCEECDKTFFKVSSLNRHKISVHEKIRPFACPNCGTRFKDKTALKYHTKKNVCITKSVFGI